MTNVPATHFVAKASLMSLDFDLLRDRYVSDFPLSADSPEFFPDCNTMIAISDVQISSCIITMTILSASMGVAPF